MLWREIFGTKIWAYESPGIPNCVKFKVQCTSFFVKTLKGKISGALHRNENFGLMNPKVHCKVVLKSQTV